jgi:dTDP-4-amino-4,6-dideoxygalactose transaminase
MTSADELALFGGAPVRPSGKSWPSWPIHGPEERGALLDVLESGQWWYGDAVAAFEEAFADFQGARCCVSCSSGTAGLEVALQALGVGPGDEVVVPAYTFVTTATAAMRLGARPVFVDVDDSWCMDPAAAADAISERTTTIVPVHFGGGMADMDRLREVAKRSGASLLEDACHAWGAKWRGRGAGTLGEGGVFSFQMTKNITAGEGGAVVSDDEDFAAACRSISNCGRAEGGAWYGHVRAGTNARLTEFQAALLQTQLARLGQQMALRDARAARLNEALAAIPGLRPQQAATQVTRRSYHLYGVRIDAYEFGCNRRQFVRAANAEGLPVEEGYEIPLYRQPVFEGLGAMDEFAAACPVAEDLAAHSGVWLPHSLLLAGETDIDDAVAICRKVKRHAHRLAAEII